MNEYKFNNLFLKKLYDDAPDLIAKSDVLKSFISEAEEDLSKGANLKDTLMSVLIAGYCAAFVKLDAAYGNITKNDKDQSDK